MSDPTPALDRLADDFQRRLRAGEAPSVDEYAARFPDLADRIREVFPVVAALERTAAPPHPLRLGDYRLVREIGRGGMGVVYEAVQESLGRRVAVKLFPAAHLGRPGLRERFEREARAAGRLHHTNIVPVFGVGTADGVPFFAMQYISGAGLDRVIATLRATRGPADRTPAGRADPTFPGLAPRPPAGPPPAVLVGETGAAYFRTVARLALEAADALAHAHAHKVQHRDIKPSNLLVDDEGTLWVTDFGLAKLDDASDLTATGDHLGTLRYAPPERFRGPADERADVYSLGATLYELLALRPAFPQTDQFALIDRIKSSVPPAPRTFDPAIPRDLDTVALKCLEKDPAKRYPSAALLAADLRAFLDGRPIAARPVGPVEAAVRWAKRKPAAATVVAAAALLLVVTSGLLVEREYSRHATRAEALVVALRRADTAELPPVLTNLADYRRRARPALQRLAAGPITGRAGLHGRLALLGDDPRYADEVADHLLVAPAEQLPPVVPIAAAHLRPHADRFWQVLTDPAADPAARVRAAGVLAGLVPLDPRWATVAAPLAELLVAIDPVEFGHLTRAVAPVLPTLAAPLMARYEREQRELADPAAVPTELAARVGRMNAAAVLLRQTLEERPDVAVWLAGTADDDHLPAVLATVRRRRAEFEPLLRAGLSADPGPEAARHTAGLAALLLTASPDDPTWLLFRHTPDPTVRSHLIRRCAPAGVPAAAVARRLAAEPDVSGKTALLLTLAEYPPAALPAEVVPAALKLYRTHAHPGLHAAAGWALRHRWGRAADIDREDAARVSPGPVPGRGWFVTPKDGTFTVVGRPGRVRIGNPEAGADPDLRDERPVEVEVGRTFAIAATEVTAERFREWPGCPPTVSGSGRRPAGRVTWFLAAAFCNWLSKEAGLPAGEWCYVPNAAGEYAAGMGPAPNHLNRLGYRLPTEAEWEVAARARADAPRFFGRADGLLTRYAWTLDNANDKAHPVGLLRPNDLGLFDVLGNVLEWADDAYTDPYPPGPRPDAGLTAAAVKPGDNHVLRGGAFNLAAHRLRSAYRYNLVPGNNPGSCGFRLARTVR